MINLEKFQFQHHLELWKDQNRLVKRTVLIILLFASKRGQGSPRRAGFRFSMADFEPGVDLVCKSGYEWCSNLQTSLVFTLNLNCF